MMKDVLSLPEDSLFSILVYVCSQLPYHLPDQMPESFQSSLSITAKIVEIVVL